MTRDDSYTDVVFSDLDHGRERQTPAPGAFNCTFEIIFPELIFCECIYGLPRGPDQTVSRAVYGPEAGGSPPLLYMLQNVLKSQTCGREGESQHLILIK